MPEVLLDAANCPRSPATLPGFHDGRLPRNKAGAVRAQVEGSEMVAVLPSLLCSASPPRSTGDR